MGLGATATPPPLTGGGAGAVESSEALTQPSSTPHRRTRLHAVPSGSVWLPVTRTGWLRSNSVSTGPPGELRTRTSQYCVHIVTGAGMLGALKGFEARTCCVIPACTGASRDVDAQRLPRTSRVARSVPASIA